MKNSYSNVIIPVLKFRFNSLLRKKSKPSKPSTNKVNGKSLEIILKLCLIKPIALILEIFIIDALEIPLAVVVLIFSIIFSFLKPALYRTSELMTVKVAPLSNTKLASTINLVLLLLPEQL